MNSFKHATKILTLLNNSVEELKSKINNGGVIDDPTIFEQLNQQITATRSICLMEGELAGVNRKRMAEAFGITESRVCQILTQLKAEGKRDA